MQPHPNTIQYPFLQGGGEMGEHARNFDWSATDLGSPANWPFSLKTSVSLLLLSKFPMFLFWGPSFICIYNDALRLSLGSAGHHQDLLGQAAEQWFPEIWSDFKPVISNVFTEGEPALSKHRLLPVFSNDHLEDRFWTFGFTPIRGEDGKTAGILAISTKIPDLEKANQKLPDVEDEASEIIAKKKILEAEAKARLAIESAELGSYEVDLINNDMKYSARFLEIWGVTSEPTRQQLIERIHPDDLPGRERAFKEAYKSGNLKYEARIKISEIGERWVRIRGKVFYDQNRQPNYLIGIAQDITDQKLFTEELEKQVSLRTAEMEIKNRQLKEINQELEQFTFAASHDMQEPLRKVHTFTSFLLNQHAEKLDGEASSFLSKIGVSVQRMKTIIDDLLNYSRHTRDSQDFVPTDLNEIIADVENDLELLIQQKEAAIVKTALPAIVGVPTQLNQLFLNLVGNALKFSKEEVPLKIEITSELLPGEKAASLKGVLPDQDYLKIVVRDNGIGFDQQYANQIFDLFKRLHTKTKYEGSGIGLGLCKKIVQNHNGAIWAESSPGDGTRFHILLPTQYANAQGF